MLAVKGGGAVFKAVRGEYGCGKTFFARWLADRARKLGFATSEVQISETETPLHRLETVYRRLMERLSTADTLAGRLPDIVDGWFYTLEEDVLAEGGRRPGRRQQLLAADRRAAGEAAGEGHRDRPDVQCGAAGLSPGPGRRAMRPRPMGCWPGWPGSRTSPPPPSVPPASKATSTTSGR